MGCCSRKANNGGGGGGNVEPIKILSTEGTLMCRRANKSATADTRYIKVKTNRDGKAKVRIKLECGATGDAKGTLSYTYSSDYNAGGIIADGWDIPKIPVTFNPPKKYKTFEGIIDFKKDETLLAGYCLGTGVDGGGSVHINFESIEILETIS